MDKPGGAAHGELKDAHQMRLVPSRMRVLARKDAPTVCLMSAFTVPPCRSTLLAV
jgi:hypothetical protein